MVDNNRRQAPPSWTFASPLAKLDLANLDQELLQWFHASKYTCVQTKILLRIKIDRSDFQTYPYYL
jgi:hypothetical protein